MSDLISRQEAIDALARMIPFAIYDISTESYTNGLTDAYNLICQLPSIQPERKTGKWIDENCSECGQYVYRGDVKNYCPRCGARMKE